MIAFDTLLVSPAVAAGMKVPPPEQLGQDEPSYDRNEYPHWHIYCALQMGRRMPSPTSHFENAQIIAAIPDDQVRMVTFADVENRGFV